MRLTEREFQAESVYAVTMSHVIFMLRKDVLTLPEYSLMSKRMKQKYHPVSDGLIFETDLILIRKRVIMAAGKEA